MNISDYIRDLTPALATSISVADRNRFLQVFADTIVPASDIDAVSFPDFISEAKADLGASVDHLIQQPQQLGLSRWSSLQAVEKFIKAFIKEKGGTPDRIHALAALATVAEASGLATIDRVSLATVQCSAGVRYRTEPSTLTQAVEAHYKALQICGSVAKQFNARSDLRIERYDGTSVDGQRVMVVLKRATVGDFERVRGGTPKS